MGKKEKRCRSRLKSSLFPSQCLLDRSLCSAWLPPPSTGTARHSCRPARPPRSSPRPPSPQCSRPTLGLWQRWLAARDQPHPCLLNRHLPNALVQPSACGSGGWQQETSPIRVSSTAISPMLSSNPRPVAAVVGSKRPAPSVSPQPKELLLDIKEENTENEAPARKRANLDHLSPEERMMRRKLKNRVAAQTARDKKKAATDSMEKQLADVQARLQESLEANAQLLKTNTQLQMENASLQQQNSELQARLSPLCPLPPPPPASPLPSPSATSPHTPLSTVLSPPETADLTCVPQQQEQGKSTMPQASSNPGLSSKDLTPWGRAPALTVVCAALLALSPKQQPPTNPSPSPSPSPPLPLKKRPTPQ